MTVAAASSPPSSLLLYTTSQTPTTPRYPSPPKPATLIPPLLHTSLHAALDRSPPSWCVEDGVVCVPDPRDLPFAKGAGGSGNGAVNGNGNGNGNGHGAASGSSTGTHTPTTRRASDPSSIDNELTLRFYLSPGSPAAQLASIRAGVSRFLAHKQWARIDTFLLGWRGVDYVGERTSEGGCGSMKLASKRAAEAEAEQENTEEVSEQVKRDMVEVWNSLPSVLPSTTGQIGTMSLPLPLLRMLAESTAAAPPSTAEPAAPHPAQAASASVPAGTPPSTGPGMEDASTATATANDVTTDAEPGSATREDFALLASFPAAEAGQGAASGAVPAPNGKSNGSTARALPLAVNRLNTPDCHSLPQDLKAFAKENKIQLWAGGTGEGSDPLPSKHLHNTLAEFIPQFPKSYLPSGSTLGSIIPFEGEGSTKAVGVEVQWVVAYTVVSRSRNVVRDKGYMIFADLGGKSL